ncbi:hypothetical protein CEP51_016329, partial [Fusarium floridanum]
MAEKRDREDTPDALDDETWFRLRDAAIAELREQNLRGFLRGAKRQRNQARKKQRRSTTSPGRRTGLDWMYRTRFSRSQDLLSPKDFYYDDNLNSKALFPFVRSVIMPPLIADWSGFQICLHL